MATGKNKKQLTIRIDCDTLEYFKEQSAASGISYQTLMNMYLNECARKKKRPQIEWVVNEDEAED